MKDLLNVESTQRVDLRDFLFGLDESPQEAHRELMGQLMIDPDTSDSFRILSGFAISNPPATSQVQVDRGRAILGQRENGLALFAVLTTAGDAQKIVDIAAFAPGTYNIYLRFELVDNSDEVRTFWDPSGGGEEFPQLSSTKRLANWSLRVESSSPGGEWFKVGEVDQASMAITDQRKFFFEGNLAAETLIPTWTWNGTTTVTTTDTSQISNGDWIRMDADGQWFEVASFVPNTTALILNPSGASIPTGAAGSSFSPDVHESGWSTEGGGAATDRSSDRETYGVTNFSDFSAAIRQCLEDIKGRGIRRWWDPDIGGMNIGFSADAVEGRLAIGSAAAFLENDGADNLELTGNSISLPTTGLRVGTVATVPAAGDGILSRGLIVGFDGAPVDDSILVGDVDFGLDFTGDPTLYFDKAVGDSLYYDRAANELFGEFAGADAFMFDADGLSANRLHGLENLQTATTDLDLVARHLQNAVVACGTFAANGAVNMTQLGDHFNINGVAARGSQGHYVITFDVALHSRSRVHVSIGGLVPAVITAGQVNTATPLTADLYFRDDAGALYDPLTPTVVHVTVVGRPNSIPTAF